MTWINVKDKLPENGQEVFVWDRRTPNSVYEQTFMNTPQRGVHWIGSDGHIYHSASRWLPRQPLPDPPEEE